MIPLTSNKQYQLCLKQTHFKGTKKFTGLVKQRHSGVAVSQISEDKFGIMKTRAVIRGAGAFKKPEQSWAKSLASRVCSVRHHYQPVSYDVTPVPATVKLPLDNFHAAKKNLSMKFNEMVGPTSYPGWYNPTVAGISVPTADLFALRDCSGAEGGLMTANNCWCGSFVDYTHEVIIRITDGIFHKFYVAGHHFDNSSNLVWPVRQHPVAGHPEWFFL